MINKFKSKLEEFGVSDILDFPEFEYTGFRNDERLFESLDFIISNNLRVLINGDPDPDGAFGSKIMIETFNRLNFFNYEFYKYTSKSHTLLDEEVSYAIYNKFDYIIIIDSSTNDMTNLEKLCTFGVKPIVIDHHVAKWELESYPKDCIVINTIIENRLRGEEKYRLSGGALTFYLMSEYLGRKYVRFKDLSAYALITLYSDCIDMTYALNRSIYYMATSLDVAQLPVYVRHFMKNYDIFKRRFIEFSFVPKINAIFRAERLDLVNKYLFEDNKPDEFSFLVEEITNIHSECRDLVNIVTDSVKRENLENIVIANLSNSSVPVKLNKLYNYTGLVANNLSSDYGKPCVVLCDNGEFIKGSLRDGLSRDYLKVFSQFCRADGHNSAFAINLRYHEFTEFIYYLKEKVNKKFFILGVDEPIEVDHDESLPNREFLTQVALFNEFSGISIPIATIKKKNTFRYNKSYSKNSAYTYHWGDFNIDSASFFPPNYEFIIKPILTKKIKLEVYNRNIIL